jgi:hypothetical protein
MGKKNLAERFGPNSREIEVFSLLYSNLVARLRQNVSTDFAVLLNFLLLFLNKAFQ